MRPVIKYHETDLQSALARALREHPEHTVDLLDVDRQRHVVKEFRANLDPRVGIAYTVKANPGRPLDIIMKERSVDAVACSTVEEIALVQEVLDRNSLPGNDPKPKILFDYPQPTITNVGNALVKGATSFVVDSRSVLERILTAKKLSSISRSVDVLCRVRTPSSGAKVHLSKKFGTSSEDAKDILRQILSCGDLGLRAGLVMHPGSQSTDPQAYADGIGQMVEIARAVGGVDVMNFGGGMPVNPHPGTPLGSAEFLKVISETARELVFGEKGILREGANCYVEPGRALAAPASDMFIPITGVEKGSGNKMQLFLGTSIYTIGFDDPVNRWEYHFIALDRAGKLKEGRKIKEYILWGNSCDSGDRFSRYRNGVKLHTFPFPAGLQPGDLLHYPRAGAYSHESFMSRFSALPGPICINYNDSRERE